MTKRKRTVIFSIMVALFFILAPSIVFYSQGYRLDFETWRINQVGAFYFDVTPPQATVTIDGKIVQTTTRITGTALTQSLTPHVYNIQISKDGYHTWEKNLEIAPKQVTEAKYITLLPEDLNFQTLLDSISAIWMAPNQSFAVLQKKIRGTNWELWLWDIEENAQSLIYVPSRLQDSVWAIQWAPGSDKFLIQIASQERIISFVHEIDGDQFLLEFIQDDIASFEFASAQNQIFFVTNTLANTSLVSADYRAQAILQTISSDIVAFAAKGDQLAWIDPRGIFWQYNGLLDPPSQLTKKPFPIKSETDYTLLLLGEHVFLQEKLNLYQLNSETQEFEEILDSSNELILSPDQQKIAITNGSELFVYYLKEQTQQPRHAENERVFLTRFSEPIQNLDWLNNHYLIFSVGGTIKVSEIDTRDRINIIDLAQYSDPQLFWKQNSTTLSIWSDANVYVSEKLFD